MTDEDEIISFDLPDDMLESDFFTKCGMSKLESVQLQCVSQFYAPSIFTVWIINEVVK